MDHHVPVFLTLFPPVPSHSTMFMLEAMTYKADIVIPKHLSGKLIDVEAWSSQCDKDCPEGEWHAIPLKFCNEQKNNGQYFILSFAISQVITGDKNFSYTFRMRTGRDSPWIWSHGWQENGFIEIEPPRQNDKWTLGPNYDHIIGNLFLGNFIAATNARKCGFTHVLNVAENLDMVYNEDESVSYKKICMKDGANNPIEDNKLAEAICWINDHNKDQTKILLNCRAGIGRAGSVAVGYVFYKRNISYEDAYDFVFAKRFVYPHTGLKESLSRLFRK